MVTPVMVAIFGGGVIASWMWRRGTPASHASDATVTEEAPPLLLLDQMRVVTSLPELLSKFRSRAQNEHRSPSELLHDEASNHPAAAGCLASSRCVEALERTPNGSWTAYAEVVDIVEQDMTLPPIAALTASMRERRVNATAALMPLGEHYAHLAELGMHRTVRALAAAAAEAGIVVAREHLVALRGLDARRRTAFHAAARRYGVGPAEVIPIFDALLRAAETLSRAAGVAWEGDAPFVAALPLDLTLSTRADEITVLRTPTAPDANEPPHALPRQKSEGRSPERGGGGWAGSRAHDDVHTAIGPAPSDSPIDACEIPSVAAPLTRATLTRHVVSGTPLRVVGGVTDEGRTRFSRSALLERFGGREVRVGRIPYPADAGAEEKRLSLSEFVHQHLDAAPVEELGQVTPTDELHVNSARERSGGAAREAPGQERHEGRPSPWYVFADDVLVPQGSSAEEVQRAASGLLADDLLQNLFHPHSLQLHLGQAGSGAPLHYHMTAINLLAYGHKRWRLYPPEATGFAYEPSAGIWSGRPLEAPPGGATTAFLECEQRGGDLLLVPEMWGHATLNLAAVSVGAAIEFITVRDEVPTL